MAITNNGVMWLNMLHFSGFRHASSRLKAAGALAMTMCVAVIASLRSNPEKAEYHCIAELVIDRNEAIQKIRNNNVLQEPVIGGCSLKKSNSKK